LKWFLAALKRQQHAGRDPSAGVKKPLNAFLGELFFAEWPDSEFGVTKLISEQVRYALISPCVTLSQDQHGYVVIILQSQHAGSGMIGLVLEYVPARILTCSFQVLTSFSGRGLRLSADHI
jgi:hypothetical protein